MFITDLLKDIFGMDLLVKAGYGIWNAFSSLSMLLLGTPVSNVAGGTLWSVASGVMNTMKIVGASLFNLLFYINFCKHSADFRDNQTMESILTMLVKLLLGNLVLVNIDGILNGLSEVSQGLFSVVAPEGAASVDIAISAAQEWSTSGLVFGFLLGMLFLFVCAGGGAVLLLHVYGLFIKVYFYIATAPLALGTIPGPQGAARSAESWFKTMCAAMGEFAGTALVLRLFAAMMNGNGFFIPCPDELSFMAGSWNIIQGMLTILMAVGGVKMVDSMIRRAFGV